MIPNFIVNRTLVLPKPKFNEITRNTWYDKTYAANPPNIPSIQVL